MAIFYSGRDAPYLLGTQLKTSDYLREPGEVVLSINATGETLGSLTGRLGYEIVGSQIGAGQSSGGLFTYTPLNSSALLVDVSGGAVHTSTGDGFTNRGAILSGAEVDAANYLNLLFMVGYNSSTNTFATNTILNGTTLSTTHDALTNMPQGKVAATYQQLLYVGNALVSGTRYPSRVYFCGTPSASGSIDWDIVNDYISVPADDNEEVTALDVNSNRLLIFKERSLYRWDENSLSFVSRDGTPTHNSVQTVGYFTFFANADGIFVYSGGKPKKISQKIQPVIDNIASLTAVRSSQDADHYYLYIGDVTFPLPSNENITITNCEIVYTISTNSFYLYSLADEVTNMADFTDGRVYFANDDGEVFEMARQGDSVYSDNGSPISSHIRCRTPIVSPYLKKRVSQMFVLSERAQGMTCRARVDDGDFQHENQLNSRMENFPVALEGFVFEFEVSHSSILPPPILNGFVFDATVAEVKK